MRYCKYMKKSSNVNTLDMFILYACNALNNTGSVYTHVATNIIIAAEQCNTLAMIVSI